MSRSLCFLLLPFMLLGGLAAQAIPRALAETLSGNKIVLPDAVLGHPAIFTIGFSRAGGDSTGRWGRELRKQLTGNSDLRFYSVAVLQDAPKMVRGIIRHGMRGSIPKNEQNTFVLIYEGEDAWKNFAGFSVSDDGYVILIDSSGAVRARVHGKAPDGQNIAVLKDALTKLSAAAQ